MLINIEHDFMNKLTDTEKNVISFINANAESIANMSISDVAEATYSSPATVSRTIKKCGISGFAELRYMLTQQVETKQDSVDVNEIFNKSLLEISNTIESLSIDTILKAVVTGEATPEAADAYINTMKHNAQVLKEALQ